MPGGGNKGNLLKPTSVSTETTIPLYRGINESHVAWDDVLKGMSRPNGGSVTALEHNTVSKLNSPFTSWTTDIAVAENFALRPSGQRVVLKTIMPVSKIVKSPNLKFVNLFQKPGTIVSESEVLIKGKVKNAEVIKVGN